MPDGPVTIPEHRLDGNWLIEWFDYPERGQVTRAALTLRKPCERSEIGNKNDGRRWKYVRDDAGAWSLQGCYDEGYHHTYSGASNILWSDGEVQIKHSYFVLGYWGGQSVVRQVGDDELRGRWTYYERGGEEVWHRAHPRLNSVQFISGIENSVDLSSASGVGESAVGRVEKTYDAFWWGSRNDMGGNRPRFRIEIRGEHLWGQHVIEFADELDLEPILGWHITNDTLVDRPGRVAGLPLDIVIWPRCKPGRKTLLVDGIPVTFDLVVKDYPTPVSRIELEFLGLTKAPDGPAFALPADRTIGQDVRPATELLVRAAVRHPDGTESPAPDGTAINLSAASPAGEQDFLASEASFEANGVSGGPSISINTSAGIARAVLRCGPTTFREKRDKYGERLKLEAAPSERWWRSEGGQEYEISYTSAAQFVVTALAQGFEPSASAELVITAGSPARLELLVRDLILPGAPPLVGPGGKPVKPGESLIEVREMRWRIPTAVGELERLYLEPFRLRVAGFGVAEKAPPSRPGEAPRLIKVVLDSNNTLAPPMLGTATLLMGVVTDAAGNPVDTEGNPVSLAAHGSQTGHVCTLRFEHDHGTGATSLPFVINAEVPELAVDSRESVWRINAEAPLPNNVFLLYLVPAFTPNGAATTRFEIGLGRNGTGSGVVWRFEIETTPTTEHAKLQHWFLSGDITDKKYFLADIGLGLVPLVGDGRDLMLYGLGFMREEEVGVLDHVTALLALAGLALDIFAPTNLPANAAAASAKAAMKVLRKIDDKPAQQLAQAIRDHLLKGTPSRESLGELADFTKSQVFGRYAQTIEELAPLGDAIKRAKTMQDAERLLTAAGLALEAIQLGPLLFMLGAYSVEEVIDLLEGLNALDAEEGQ